MKHSKVALFLVAFLIWFLSASQSFAAISYQRLDRTYVPFAKIGQNSVNPTPLLGFRIDGVDTTVVHSFIYLEYLTLKSFITKAFSVRTVALYAETNGQKGLQTTLPSNNDQLIWASDTRNMQFDSNDTLKMGQIHYCLRQCVDGEKAVIDSNLFFVAIEAHHDSVEAFPLGYNGQCLEVIIDTARLVLSPPTLGVEAINHDTIYNEPVWSAPEPCTTGFKPQELPMGDPCRYRLCLDTQGPQYDLHFCNRESGTGMSWR